MTDPYVGPDDEQLGLAEDVERLAGIGDLILAGHARIEDFDLKRFEVAFVNGYLRADEAPRDCAE